MKLKVTFEMDEFKMKFRTENATWEGLSELVKRSTFMFMMAHKENIKEVVPAEESNSD
jgi:hypothetical protein